MIRKHISSLFFVTLLLFPFFIFAQPGGGGMRDGGQMPDFGSLGAVLGSILETDNQPAKYATVIIKNLSDSTTITGGMTDEEGRFLVIDIPWGSYYCEINAFGYSKNYTPSFTLSPTSPRHILRQYKLSQKIQTLQSVEVVAQKEMLQTNLDKTVYRIENNVIAEGATALETLSEIPSVDVDIEGNVSMRGSGNVTILIDGHPTNLTLDQIPASQIESIEVITNPSARLEPDGMSGIINIILKKRKEPGFNALFGIGGGFSLYKQRLYVDNGNYFMNINYSHNKINLYANYNFRIGNFRNGGELDRTSWTDSGDTTFMHQETERKHRWISHNVKLALDYYINKKNTIYFSFGYNNNANKDTNTMFSDNSGIWSNELIKFNEYNQFGSGKRKGNNFNGNINYKKTFDKKGMELTSDVYFTQMSGFSENPYLQNFIFPVSRQDYYQRTKTTTLNRTATAQLDFVTPVGNGGRIETGYKFSFRSIGQDYSLFNGNNESNLIEDVLQRNNFEYRELLNAAYFIYSNSFWKKLKVQLGLRGEIANTFSDLKSSDTVYKRPYYNLFPTAHIRYDINDSHSLQLSYSLRVTRPSFWNLNPFVDVSDKQNIRMGNPDLKPEFAHNMELGYNAYVKNSNFNITFFYRVRTGLITRYTEMKQAAIYDDLIHYELIDGQIYSTPVVSGFDTLNTFPYTLTSNQNINKSQNFGLEVIYGQRFWKFWKITFSGDFYRIMINSEQLIDENLLNDWAFGFRLNQTFNLPKNFDVQLNFRFRSKVITTGSMGWMGGGVGQGRQNASYSLNFGIRKTFLKNTLSLSFNIRNLIYNPSVLINSFSSNTKNGYNSNSTRYRSAFQTNLTLTYKLNNYKAKREPVREIDTIEPGFGGE